MAGLTLDQIQQVQHVSRLAVLALCARGVAESEFSTTPEVSEVIITVRRSAGNGAEAACEVTFVNGDYEVGSIAL